jgi:hypothetical protein
MELEERFGAVSSESQTIAGQWRHERQLYRDESVRIFVDVPHTEENRQFFIAFKEGAPPSPDKTSKGRVAGRCGDMTYDERPWVAARPSGSRGAAARRIPGRTAQAALAASAADTIIPCV